MTPRQRQDRQVPKYRRLIKITQRVVANARQVIEKAKGTCGADLTDTALIEALSQQVEGYCDLADRVIDQARRRVLEHELDFLRH